jgi:spore coat polysaccharide biosynthesis predicted glycosyltransferase SpsG
LKTAASALVILGRGDVEIERAGDPVRTVSHVANAELMALIEGARMTVVGGGSLLLQALAFAAPCLTLPLHRDQYARVTQLQSIGAVRTTTPDPVAIATAAANLWLDEPMRMTLRKRSADLNLYNALPQALDALQHLLCPAGP